MFRLLDGVSAFGLGVVPGAVDASSEYDSPLPTQAGALYEALADAYPRARFVLTVREAGAWWADLERDLSCVTERQRSAYCRANGLQWSGGRESFIAAYEARNDAIVQFFANRNEPHRLLVLPDLDEAPPKPTWEALCNFLEA